MVSQDAQRRPQGQFIGAEIIGQGEIITHSASAINNHFQPPLYEEEDLTKIKYGIEHGEVSIIVPKRIICAELNDIFNIWFCANDSKYYLRMNSHENIIDIVYNNIRGVLVFDKVVSNNVDVYIINN